MLDPYSDCVGVYISLNNSSSLSFLNVYVPPIRSFPTDSKTDSFSPSTLSSSRDLFILGDFNCHHPLWDSQVTSDPRGKYSTGSSLLISSSLNDRDIPTILHRSSRDISFAPPSLVLFCSWEVLQALGSDHQPILLTNLLSPIFRHNERPPSFNFQKARWDNFSFYFDSHCPSAEEYSPLSSVAALFTSLALNAAKFSIPFGSIKRYKSNPKSVYSILCSVAGSPSSSFSFPNFPNCSSPRESASVFADYLTSHLSVYQPKTLCSRTRDYLSELRQATCLEVSRSSFYSPFFLAEFLAAASNLSSSLPGTQT